MSEIHSVWNEDQEFVPEEFNDPNQSIHSTRSNHTELNFMRKKNNLITTQFTRSQLKHVDIKPPIPKTTSIGKSRIFQDLALKSPVTVKPAALKISGEVYKFTPFIDKLQSLFFQYPVIGQKPLEKEQNVFQSTYLNRTPTHFSNNLFIPNAQTQYLDLGISQDSYINKKADPQTNTGNFATQPQTVMQTMIPQASPGQDIFQHLQMPQENNQDLNMTTQQFAVVNDITRLEINFNEMEPINNILISKWKNLNMRQVIFDDKNIHFDQRDSILIYSEAPMIIPFMMIFQNQQQDIMQLKQLCQQINLESDYSVDPFKEQLSNVVGNLRAKFLKGAEITLFIQSEYNYVSNCYFDVKEENLMLIDDIVTLTKLAEPNQLFDRCWDPLLVQCKQKLDATYTLQNRVIKNLVYCKAIDYGDNQVNDLALEVTKLNDEIQKKVGLIQDNYVDSALIEDDKLLELLQQVKQQSPDSQFQDLVDCYKFLEDKEDNLRSITKKFRDELLLIQNLLTDQIRRVERIICWFYQLCDILQNVFHFYPKRLEIFKLRLVSVYKHLLQVRIPHQQNEIINSRVYQQVLQNLEDYKKQIITLQQALNRQPTETQIPYKVIMLLSDSQPRRMQQMCKSQIRILQRIIKELLKDIISLQSLRNFYMTMTEQESEILQVQEARLNVTNHLKATQNPDIAKIDFQVLKDLKEKLLNRNEKIHGYFQVDAQGKPVEGSNITNQFVILTEWIQSEMFAIDHIQNLFSHKLQFPKLEVVEAKVEKKRLPYLQ